MILLIAVFLSVGLTSLFYGLYIVMDVRDIPVSFEVSDRVGVDVDDQRLSFGKIPLDSKAKRTLVMKNDFNEDAKVELVFSGEIEDFMEVEESDIYLAKDEEKEFSIFVNVPSDAELGNYSGNLKVFFKRI